MSKNSKVVSTGSLKPVRGGKDSGCCNGPTGSERTYRRGSGEPRQGTWNPQKAPASKYAINGVGKG